MDRARLLVDQYSSRQSMMHRIEMVSRLARAHLEQLSELIEAATRADGHGPLGEHKFLRLQRGDDLSLAVLAFGENRLAGYAHTVTYGQGGSRHASCELVVHPQFRRLGFGRMLLSHAMLHACVQSARRLDLWAYNGSAWSASVAEQFGFRPVRRLLHLRRRVGGSVSAPCVSGATIRPFQPGADEESWLALNSRIFAQHPENGSWTMDDLRLRITQAWFHPDDLLMLEVGGELAGFCWLKITGRVGEIYVIGVTPELQGRGLGCALLAASFSRLSARGADTARIYVDESNERAVALYRSFGFRHHHTDLCTSRDLRPDREAASYTIARGRHGG